MSDFNTDPDSTPSAAAGSEAALTVVISLDDIARHGGPTAARDLRETATADRGAEPAAESSLAETADGDLGDITGGRPSIFASKFLFAPKPAVEEKNKDKDRVKEPDVEAVPAASAAPSAPAAPRPDIADFVIEQDPDVAEPEADEAPDGAESETDEPPAAVRHRMDNWKHSIPYDETGILIRPAKWTGDQTETAMIIRPDKSVKAADADETDRAPLWVRLGRRMRPAPRHGVLTGVLLLQTALSLRNNNTAFEDEALYIYSGHLELAHLINGAQVPDFALYFSGAPVLYPVLGAYTDQLGGLFLTRLVSLFFMLGATGLLYLTSRRLFGVTSALCAATIFSTAASVLFLGDFATYDAPSVFLLSLAAWIAVRTAGSKWPYYLLAVLPILLAVSTKYASLLFAPTVVVLAGLAALPYQGRRFSLLRPVAMTVLLTTMAYGLLRLGGSDYVTGIQVTTTARATGTTSTSQLLYDIAIWCGPVFSLALLGALFYVLRPSFAADAGPQPGRNGRIAMAVLLVGTALLAPIDQLHLHTDVSLHKHIAFGLLFAAPLAGYGLVRLVGTHQARLQLGIGVWVILMAFGYDQAVQLFHSWNNSASLIAALREYQQPGGQYLVEVDEIPIYYLRGDQDAEWNQFTSTYTFTYIDSKGQSFTGDTAYAKAIEDDYFTIVAYNFSTTGPTDLAIQSALKANPDYKLEKKLPEAGSGSSSIFYVWVKSDPAAAATTATTTATTTITATGH